jgi:DNA-3-methyladenine glycosylase I
MPKDKTRCLWARTELSIAYHDLEWGVPTHDDRILFEFLTLEGAQAGLSWETILRKRDNYRSAFVDFDYEVVARFGKRELAALMSNEGIIRNRLKLTATIQNANAFLDVRGEFGTFDRYVWSFVGGTQKQNSWSSMKDVPSRAVESDAMSKDLVRRGFRFVGPTICYAFMQAVGMVNDHTTDCFRYREVKATHSSRPSRRKRSKH